MNFAVGNGNDGLDTEKAAGQGHGFGNAAAPLQIFQRVQQGDEADVVPLFHEPVRQGFGIHAASSQVHGVFRQNPGAGGCGKAVHHENIGIVLRRNAGALIGAGELFRNGDNDGAVSGPGDLFKKALKDGRGGLAGGGQHRTLRETAVKRLLGQGHAV